MALSEKLEGHPAQTQGSGAIKFDYIAKAVMSVLYIETPDGEYDSGTGVIVEEPTFSSPLLMTCNHIIPTKEIAKTSFVYFDRLSEQKPGTAVEGEKLFDFSTFKSSPEDKYDYTIIAMNPDHMPKPTSGEERIRFPLNAYKDLGDSRLKEIDNVYVIQYPSMDGKCELRASGYRVQFSSGYRFGHIAETQPGSSGCPVLKEYNKKWVLVGLHRCGHTFGKDHVIVNSAIHVEAIHKDLLGMRNPLGDPDWDEIRAMVGLNHPPPTSTVSISPKVPTVGIDEKPPKDGVFDSKSFMKVYKDDFLKIVPAEHIALNLEIEDVIDDVLCRDMKNSARSVAASILYGHLSKTAKRETISDLCKVMKDRSTGFPKMRDLADAMEKNKPYKP